MGSILSETGVITRIENVVKPLKDFFGAVFFVTVGMMVNPEMIVTYAYPIFVITMVVLVGQVTCSVFGFVVSGQNLKTAVYAGFSLSQVGEFAFIIASLGKSLGVIDDFVYPIIVTVSVITTFLTPIMMKSASKAYKFLDKALPQKWLDYINQNSGRHSSAESEEKLWQALFKGYFVRIILFSLILSAILAFVGKIMAPFAYRYMPDLPARILLTLAALLFMSPFLKGLTGWNGAIYGKLKNIFLKTEVKKKEAEEEVVCDDKSCEFKRNFKAIVPEQIKNALQENTATVKNFIDSEDKISRIYSDLWSKRAANRLPLLILTSFRLMLVAFFIVTAVHQFLTENPRVIFVMLLASILLITRSKWLLEQYLKMENQFLDNLNGEVEENKED